MGQFLTVIDLIQGVLDLVWTKREPVGQYWNVKDLI